MKPAAPVTRTFMTLLTAARTSNAPRPLGCGTPRSSGETVVFGHKRPRSGPNQARCLDVETTKRLRAMDSKRAERTRGSGPGCKAKEQERIASRRAGTLERVDL